MMKNRQILGDEDPGLQNLAHAMQQQDDHRNSVYVEQKDEAQNARVAARQRRKSQIDKDIAGMTQKALEVVGNAVTPVVNTLVGFVGNVVEEVVGVAHAGMDVLLPNQQPNQLNNQEGPQEPVQQAAPIVPFAQKYPITYSEHSKLPQSETIDNLTRDYYQLYVLRNLNDYTQVWGPQDQAREAAENNILRLQKDVIDYYFSKAAEASQTAEGAQRFLKDMQALIENIEGLPVGEHQMVYRLYLEASTAIYQRHKLNETLSANARESKRLNESARGEIRNEIASITRRENELTRLRDTLAREFTEAVDKSTQEMQANDVEREGITDSLTALGRTKAIYQKLSENQTISPQNYEFLRDNEISPNHQHEKNQRLLEMARGMIALQPGYDEIDRRTKQYLESFTERSLHDFIAALAEHITAVNARISTDEVDVENNLPLLKLYMHLLKNLVPDLPIVAIQGMIHYDKQDYDVLEMLRGDYNEAWSLFEEISTAFNAQIDTFKKTSRDFINKTVGLINDDIATYLRAPTQDIADRIVKRLDLYQEFFSDFLLISKGDRLENLTEFTVDDFNTAEPRMVLNALINRYKTAIISQVSRIKFGTNNDSLNANVSSLMFLNESVNRSRFNAQKAVLTSAFREISMIAKAKSASAVQRLGMVASHKMIGGLKEALYFNNLFRDNIANRLNIAWESQEKLILKIMGRLAVNTNIDNGMTFYEGLIDALVESGVNRNLAVLHYKTLPLSNKPTILELKLNDHFAADAPFIMTEEMNRVIVRLIDNHPELESIDFGRFVPSNDFFSSLLNDYENIGYYYFPMDGESNPKVETLDKNETVIVTTAKDDRINKTVYYRSRKALLIAMPSTKSATQELSEAVKEDFKHAKEKAAELKGKAVDLKQKGKAAFDKILRKNRQNTESDSPVSSASSSSTPSIVPITLEPVVDLYPQFLSSLIDYRMSPSRLRQAMDSREFPWGDKDKFHTFMLNAYKKLKMSPKTAIEMRQLALDDNHEAAYQWLEILKDMIDPRPYINSAHEFFLSIDGKAVIASSIQYLQQFADSVLEDFAELKPADYVSQISTLIQKLDLDSREGREVLKKLFRAYVLSRDLLNDYNNETVMRQHFAFINSLLVIEPIRSSVLDVLLNQFIFSSLYSANTLRGRFEQIDLSINTELVLKLLDEFLWEDFSQDPLMFGNHLRILMTNLNLTGNLAVHQGFVRGLAHYLSVYSSDVDFPEQLHVYVEYLRFMEIPLSQEQALALLTPINAMSKTKWRNSQADLASLVELFPNSDTQISKELFDAFEHYEKMARAYQLNQVVSVTRRDLENEDWVVQDDDLPVQLAGLPLVAQNTYRYFTSKLTAQVADANLKLAKQLKKLDIMVNMLNGLVAIPAPQEDPCVTARNALAALGFFSAGNTAIYRFVNSLESSGMLGERDKIIALRDTMKTYLYDLLLVAFIEKYMQKQRALLTTVPAADQALADLTRLDRFLNAMLTGDRSAPNFGATLMAESRVLPVHTYPFRLFVSLTTNRRDIDKLFERLTPLLAENVTLDTVRAQARVLDEFRQEIGTAKAGLVQALPAGRRFLNVGTFK